MNNHKLANKNALYVFISLVLSLSIYLAINSVVFAQTQQGQVGIEGLIDLNNDPSEPVTTNILNSTTTDAIAVRIVANPAQYSIDEWYAKQGFTGSPQKIKVDGYDAVRDNRTVYVAATNIKGFCTQSLQLQEYEGELVPTGGLVPFSKLFHINEANAVTWQHYPLLTTTPCSNNGECGAYSHSSCALSRLYFNIYIITYSQGAAAPTSDVFGKILSNWKFNNNLNDQLGTCSMPPKNCSVPRDCGAEADYDCTNSKCVSKRKCLSDADCTGDALCNSPKSKILRDVKRLQSLNAINQSLKSYKNIHNKYPILAAGTFLPQSVISTWPSWQNVFVPQIGTTSFSDPINKIGICNTVANATTTMAGFEEDTCWNGSTKRYYNGSNSANLELPAGSYAMAYSTDINGSNYKLCANMETNYNFMTGDNVLVNLAAANCRTTAPAGYTGSSNNPPVIVAMNLNGVSGEEYNGYIKAEDPEGNPMTFSTIIGPEVAGQWDTWGSGVKPILKPTTDPKQKKLYSTKAGDIGNYSISIKVVDSNGASVTTSTVIKISGGAPIINASNVDYDLSSDPNNSLNYNLYFDDINFDYLDLSYSTTLASAAQNWLKQLSSLFVTPALAQFLPTRPIISIEGEIIPIGGGNTRPPIIACSNIVPSGGAWRINKGFSNCFNLNNGLKGKVYPEADGRYRLNIYGTIDTSAYNQDTNLTYKIKVHNSLGKTTEKSFTVKLKSNPPQLDFSCNKKVGLYEDYACQINNLNTKNEATTYTYSYIDSSGVEHASLPSGFEGNPDTGLISGMPTNIGSYKFKITAENEYGASVQKEYDLAVESYCGQTMVPYAGGPWDQRGEVKNQGGYYKTVLIGGQCWLKDNLNVSTAISYDHYQQNNNYVGNITKSEEKPSWLSKVLSLLFKPYAVSAQVISGYPQLLHGYVDIGLCFNGDNAYCEANGRLYQASEVMAGSASASVRGICPTGYHIPSETEFTALNTYLMSLPTLTTPNVNNDLKENGDSGFEGFLSGSADKPSGTSTVTFSDLNNFGNFWSSTIQSAKNYFRQLSSGGNSFPSQLGENTRYYSLRCIQDKLCPSSCLTCNTIGECCPTASNPLTWNPLASAKCGNFIQTSNCGTTKNATGTISCIAPQTCGGSGVSNTCGCTPNCYNKICGSNGCGGTCGTCPTGATCSGSGAYCIYSHTGSGTGGNLGTLKPLCHPNCTNKACGSDGCGGSCGTCSAGSTCAGNGAYCMNTAIIGGGIDTPNTNQVQ
ncbi:MAG: FISUMP domain-containing protein [Candidatus Falkowbacteria bacterium]